MLRPDRENDEDNKDTLHFDAWLTTQGATLCELADAVFRTLPAPSVTPGRKHRADAVERRKAATHTVIANMAALSLHPICTHLAIPTKNLKRTRYDRKAFSADVLRATLKAMEENDLLDVTPAVYKERRTVLRLTPALQQKFEHLNIAVEDLGRAPGRETIELWQQTDKSGRKELVDYKDTLATISLHDEMDAINSAVSQAVDFH